MEAALRDRGIDPSKASERVRSLSRDRGRKRTRSESLGVEENNKSQKTSSKSRSRTRSVSRGEGFKDIQQKIRAEGIANKQRKERNRDARKGESDRHVFDFKPKHLLSGKRKAGKTDRR